VGKRVTFELIDLLVDRAETALLPRTSLKSDQTRAKHRVGGTRAFAHLGEVKWYGTVKWFNATKGFGFIGLMAAHRRFSCISAPSSAPHELSTKARSFVRVEGRQPARKTSAETFAPCDAV